MSSPLRRAAPGTRRPVSSGHRLWALLGRTAVDVNTDSHDAVLKANPRHVPATDAVRVFVPGR